MTTVFKINNRKRGASTLLFASVVLAILGLLVLVVMSLSLGQGNLIFWKAINPIGEDSQFKLCQQNANDKTDIDGDGAYDVCDYCVVDIVDKGQISSSLQGGKWADLESFDSYNPGIRENIDDSGRWDILDKDGDKVIDICDADPEKEYKWFNFDTVKKNCKALEDDDKYGLTAKTKKSDNGAYYICEITI
ncbi:hypothetical protein H6503_01770 [Candidatus Woesearchaeota archaeon]|nr:hypothetical protein [Candidatus Woesearchaeota archaeon]